MALIKCHECGSSMSIEADACPKCGARARSRADEWSPLLAAWGTVLILIVFAALAYWH